MTTTLLAIALGLAMFNAGFMLISFNTQDKLIAELTRDMSSKDGRGTLLYQMYFHLAEDSQNLTKKIERLEDDLEDVQADLNYTQDVLESHHRGLHAINAAVMAVDIVELLSKLLAEAEEEMEGAADDIIESFSKLLAEVGEEMEEAADDDDTN